MERNIKESVIIDFFGLPGSGKTTIAKKLSNQLINEGYKVQNNIYKINNEYSSFKRMSIKLLNTVTFTYKNFSYMRELFSILEKNTFINKKELFKQWINICFVLTNINKVEDKKIIIADQGIIQAAISLTYNKKNTEIKPIIEKLQEKVYIKLIHIYISTDSEKCLIRLSKRTGGKSRVEFEGKDNIKINHLNSMERLCIKISSDYDCLIIDNNFKNRTSILNKEIIKEIHN